MSETECGGNSDLDSHHKLTSKLTVTETETETETETRTVTLTDT